MRLCLDMPSLSTQIKASLYLMDTFGDNELGPYPLHLSDLNCPTLRRDLYPHILTADFGNAHDIIWNHPRYPNILFVDSDFLQRIQHRNCAMFEIVKFQVKFEI